MHQNVALCGNGLKEEMHHFSFSPPLTNPPKKVCSKLDKRQLSNENPVIFPDIFYDITACHNRMRFSQGLWGIKSALIKCNENITMLPGHKSSSGIFLFSLFFTKQDLSHTGFLGFCMRRTAFFLWKLQPLVSFPFCRD